MQKIGLFLTGMVLSASAWANQAGGLTNDPAAVNTALDGLADNAISLFDKVVPVILAVVGLGVLVHFVKKIKKS
jgi:hypothetical protein